MGMTCRSSTPKVPGTSSIGRGALVHASGRAIVRLQVLPDEPVDEADQIIEKLVGAGLLSLPPGYSTAKPVSGKKRQEVASSLGRAPGKPLSDIIMEDRGEW